MSAFPLPEALLCLSALLGHPSSPGATLQLPSCSHRSTRKKKTKNQGALVGFLNYEDRKGSFTPLLKERVYLIPNCKSQVRFQHPLSVLSFNNCVIYPKCEASPRHQNCGSMLSQPLPSVVSLSNYTSCFAGNR